MAERITVWLAYVDYNDEPVIEEVGATETAQQIRLDHYPSYMCRTPKSGPKDHYHRTRDAAVAALRKTLVRELRYAENKAEQARESLAALDKAEMERP
jgi:hypothetical protein